ncbi:MAG: GNAT family N-acetyltransferase [Euryarchaeota archaeon]|jgi:ribosomal protein S18 acetylase RimI-like enzyme|nr:GNAT family N-acetyltransferase [Euryarchaeota archaeon]
MNVRRLEDQADVRGLIRVHGLAWREAYDGLLPDEILQQQSVDPSDKEVQYWFERLRENRDGVLVATDTDETVRGFADFRWEEDETKESVGRGEAELKAIYVEPDCWGRGLGTALLERGLELLPDGVNTLYLEMLSGNETGRRFYEARGFDRTGAGKHEIGEKSYPTGIYTLRC